MVLVDYGAEVVKVEPPHGEHFRSMPAFTQWNRGKRGAIVDLTSDAGREQVADAARWADVVIHNLRPQAAERFGIDYPTLSARNARLVHVSISGFGRRGRYAHYKAYEGIVAAKTGQHVIQNGYRDDGPIYDAIFKCSFGASMLAVIGVLAALHVREVTGEGQEVHTSLTQSNFVYSYDGIRAEDETTSQALSHVQGRDPHNVMPGYRIAECADGRWMQSGSAMGGIFDNLMRGLGIDQYFADPRFEDGPRHLAPDALQDLLSWIDAAYKKRPLEEWLHVLEEHDAGFAPFLSTQEFMECAQVLHNGHVIDVTDPTVGPMKQIGPLVRFHGDEWNWPGPAPRLGEHLLPTAAEAVRGSDGGASEPPEPRCPLEDVTILDLATFAAAPGGPGLLADLGARVVKIEPPAGDPLGAGPFRGGELFFRVNRGKERVAVNLKDPEGQEIVHRLVAGADVVVHNFRPGVPDRLGIDYETLRAINERIVYVYAASFGSTGPDSHRPAFDAVISALAGGEVLQAGAGNPPQQRQTTDHSGLLAVAIAILLGLRERDRTGRSQNVETTMLAGAAYLLSDDFLRYDGKPARRIPDQGQHGLGPLYRLYRTSRGWVFLACVKRAEWLALCAALGHTEWIDDPRFATAADREANATELARELEAVFLEREAQTWEQLLTEHDVACVVANRTWGYFLFDDRASDDPELTTEFEVDGIGKVTQTGLAVNLSRTPGRVGVVEPVGASTRRLVASLGYTDAEIDDLEQRGVLRRGDVSSDGH
jgi:crotonobetainyl-CoA:carnitine CoA-transferase CaiB-like acyl-CoA transferase